VILGTGWGATTVLRNIDPRLYDVTVVSPRNFFLFTPLLPSVTVGTLDIQTYVDWPVLVIRLQDFASSSFFFATGMVFVSF